MVGIIGPGSKVVCIRDWPWKDGLGEPCQGPLYGTKWIVAEYPSPLEPWWHVNDYVKRNAPYLTLVEWYEFRPFAAKNFRPIDPDAELEILRKIAKGVDNFKVKETEKIFEKILD